MQFTQALTAPLLSPLTEAITAVYGGVFNPTTLFSDGSIGVLYDNNDLTTMFVDAAGTTPATVNGLVGLQLDKSQGLVLGAELVPTGDMSDISAWTVAGAGTTIAVVGGELEVTGAGGSFPSARTPAFTTVVGKWYKVTGTGRRGTTASSVYLSTTGGAYSSALNSTTSNQDLSFVFQAVGTSTFVSCLISSATGTGTAYFDNISVRELPGNHRYQATTGSKPILRGTPTGGNLVTNGDFASGTGWTTGTGWAIGSGVATKTAGVAASLTSPISLSSGRVYRVTYTTTVTGGVFQIAFTGGGTVAGTARSVSGTYVEYLTAGASSNTLSILTTTASAGTVDNIEVFDVSAGSVTAPYGLQYDGVDDFLQTASVNFSATDKMFVCAGVRKLSDAARGAVVDMGAGNNGFFNIEAPSGTGSNDFVFRNGGTISVNAQQTGNASPITAVVTGLGDISGDLCTLRKNGAQVAQSVGDQGTGNFGNYAIYFGRRGGISLPYNGLDFGLVICGKTLTAAQISSTERWMAQRTGVSI